MNSGRRRFLTLEVVIRIGFVVAFGLAAGAGLRPLPSVAQEESGRGKQIVWHLEDLRGGFCVQLLLDSTTVARNLAADLRPARADQVPDLHPAIRGLVQRQPEFAGYTPSQLCLYYFSEVDAGTVRVKEKDSRKSPLLAAWTAAAVAVGSGTRRDVALELASSSGGLSHAGQVAGLDLVKARSVIGLVPAENEDGVPSSDSRYQFKIGKTLITWDGRAVGDSARVDQPIRADWLARGRHGGWWHARLHLAPGWSRGMAGSLRIQGEDAFAKALKASPTRFVGPLYRQGGGELQFGR